MILVRHFFGASALDIDSFSVLEPIADGFRNYINSDCTITAEKMLIDKAQLLTLTAPEMTVLIGGLRVLGANYNSDKNGVFTENQETLSNDFFVNLLDMNNEWNPSTEAINGYIAKDRNTGVIKWHASRVDLIFGSNAQLRAIAEVYASDDSKTKFINDFIAAWVKVMELDRFDIK